MAVAIRARFDGRVLIPEEPVDLPQDQILDLEWSPLPLTDALAKREQAKSALIRLQARAVQGANVPDEALRRENMYE